MRQRGYKGIKRGATVYETAAAPRGVIARCMLWRANGIGKAHELRKQWATNDSPHTITHVEGDIFRWNFDPEVTIDVGDALF